MRRSSRPVRFFLLIVFQTVVILLLAELGLRALAPHHDKLRQLLYLPAAGSTDFDRHQTLEQLLATTGLGWSPGRTVYGFVLNSRGFRTREYTEPKPAGSTRIAVIGDSFVFAGGGLPYSLGWPHLLEQNLRGATGEPIDVFALGVPATGPHFERRLWQLEGRRVQADVVVLAFFVGNDFTDEISLPFTESPTTGLARISYLARWVRNFWRLQDALEEPTAPAPPAPEIFALRLFDDAKAPSPGPWRRQTGGLEQPEWTEVWEQQMRRFSPEALIKIEAGRTRICDRRFAKSMAEPMAKIENLLRVFHAEVTHDGTRMTVLIIPDRFQVNLDERPAILARLGREEKDFDWDLPQRRLRALFEREGIDHLDLLETFRNAAAAGEVLYEAGDTHWSPAGNALAARELAAHLETP